MQKIITFQWFNLEKLAKIPILGPFQASLGQFGPILPQNGQKKIFRKKWTPSHFNIYYSLPSCKKSENFNDWISRKSQKTLKMGHFGPLLPQNGPKIFFSENRAPSLFEDYNFASSCKKSENFNEPISRKTHNRRTNEHEVGPSKTSNT